MPPSRYSHDNYPGYKDEPTLLGWLFQGFVFIFIFTICLIISTTILIPPVYLIGYYIYLIIKGEEIAEISCLDAVVMVIEFIRNKISDIGWFDYELVTDWRRVAKYLLSGDCLLYTILLFNYLYVSFGDGLRDLRRKIELELLEEDDESELGSEDEADGGKYDRWKFWKKGIKLRGGGSVHDNGGQIFEQEQEWEEGEELDFGQEEEEGLEPEYSQEDEEEELEPPYSLEEEDNDDRYSLPDRESGIGSRLGHRPPDDLTQFSSSPERAPETEEEKEGSSFEDEYDRMLENYQAYHYGQALSHISERTEATSSTRRKTNVSSKKSIPAESGSYSWKGLSVHSSPRSVASNKSDKSNKSKASNAPSIHSIPRSVRSPKSDKSKASSKNSQPPIGEFDSWQTPSVHSRGGSGAARRSNKSNKPKASPKKSPKKTPPPPPPPDIPGDLPNLPDSNSDDSTLDSENHLRHTFTYYLLSPFTTALLITNSLFHGSLKQPKSLGSSISSLFSHLIRPAELAAPARPPPPPPPGDPVDSDDESLPDSENSPSHTFLYYLFFPSTTSRIVTHWLFHDSINQLTSLVSSIRSFTLLLFNHLIRPHLLIRNAARSLWAWLMVPIRMPNSPLSWLNPLSYLPEDTIWNIRIVNRVIKTIPLDIYRELQLRLRLPPLPKFTYWGFLHGNIKFALRLAALIPALVFGIVLAGLSYIPFPSYLRMGSIYDWVLDDERDGLDRRRFVRRPRKSRRFPGFAAHRHRALAHSYESPPLRFITALLFLGSLYLTAPTFAGSTYRAYILKLTS